ncbi:MAG: hypothetical protein GX057_03400 [Clostridiales bacterium]|nr:hypothetical protein [Clostridiales bacterium]
MSRYFMLAEFAAACIIIIFGWEVKGAVAFAFLAISALVLCNDMLAALAPCLFMSIFLTKCYNSADTFLPYAWVALPAALAALIHLFAYGKRARITPNFWGTVAVAVAVSLGGLGTISKDDYWNATSLFYVGLLGIGTVIFYLWAITCVNEHDGYDIFSKFAGIVYLMGILACFSVLHYYWMQWDMVWENRELADFQASNNLATFLMIAMPASCWFSIKNKAHLLGFGLMYACLILSGSRGGLLMGTIEFFICLAYLAAAQKKYRIIYVCTILAVAPLIYFNVENLLSLYKIDTIGELVSHNEARYELLRRLDDDIRSNMLFGRGLGYSGNSDIYNPVKGAMHWYHMMIPQIIGSLGVVGVFAYMLQFTIRVFSVLRRTNAYKLVLGLSYLGLLLMSQVNPGEFSPPYSLLAVLFFVFVDKYSCQNDIATARTLTILSIYDTIL